MENNNTNEPMEQIHILIEKETLDKLDKLIPKGERSNVVRKLIKIFLKACEAGIDPYQKAKEELEKRMTGGGRP